MKSDANYCFNDNGIGIRKRAQRSGETMDKGTFYTPRPLSHSSGQHHDGKAAVSWQLVCLPRLTAQGCRKGMSSPHGERLVLRISKMKDSSIGMCIPRDAVEPLGPLRWLNGRSEAGRPLVLSMTASYRQWSIGSRNNFLCRSQKKRRT